MPSNTPISAAAKALYDEGYSRVPVYRDNIDNIIGVLMYKDILDLYMQHGAHRKNIPSLDAPIESLVKKVIYTPETKKVSQLLTEFRKKQVHFAIVVDEYGGTEGIVTIEDILEEIVGEIADEYDDFEDTMVTSLPGGGWIVNANLSIIDVEDKLGVTIPQDGDYDTIGGYIFFRAGSIPPKGFVIQHDNFELEILSSSDRCVEKVRITPIAHFNEQ
jgi:CBS domain containing-hemolysin-like protein